MTVDNGQSDWVHVDAVDAAIDCWRNHVIYLLAYIGVDPDASDAELEALGAPSGIVAARKALTRSSV